MGDFSFTETVQRTIAEMHDRIAALKAENAKLRKERDEWRRVAESKQDIIDHMRDTNAENAKLRELLQEAVDAASMRDITDWPYGKRLRLVERARELGIEVDE